ncbi:hypothetical protein ABT364_04265 [Massilia sp. SR12]
MSEETLKKGPPLIHCKVEVTKVTNPSTGAEEYVAKYHPKVLRVIENDTILSFKLSGKTPDDVRIASVTVIQEGNTQLSTPSISTNRKSVTLTDINTEKETLNLQFKFTNTKTNARMTFAPCEENGVYPEVDNDPPFPP